MNINIKATNLEHTDAIDSYVRKKVEAFGKLIDINSNQVFMYVELEKTRPDQTNADDLYRAEVTVDNSGEMFYADVATHDLYAAIDLVKDEILRKIKKEHGKKNDLMRRGMRKMKKLLRFNR
jgi:ribosomal subunit interface protein